MLTQDWSLSKLCEHIRRITMCPNFLQWHDAFAEDTLNPQTSELYMHFDFLEMPRREAIVFPADESVLSVIFTSLERIADFSSLMKCLNANDSTAAWVIAYNSASALEWDTEAWVRLVDEILTENNVIKDPLVDLRDLWHPAQSESE